MCNLLREVKARTGMSGNQIAKAIGASPELVSSWNRDKTEPNGKNTLKLMKLGKIERDEAIKLFENGYISLSLLIMTASGWILALASFLTVKHCILC